MLSTADVPEKTESGTQSDHFAYIQRPIHRSPGVVFRMTREAAAPREDQVGLETLLICYGLIMS